MDDLNKEGKISQVIKGLEAIHKKHKYGSYKFSYELTDLVIGIAASTPCKCLL